MMPKRPLCAFILRPTYITHQWTRTLTTTPLLRAAQPQPSSPPEAPVERPSADAETTSKIDSLFGNLASRRPVRNDRPFGSTFGTDFSPSPPTGGRFRRRGLDIANMDDLPETPSSVPETPPPVIPEAEIKYPRLGPSHGRMVKLDPERGRDLVRGISIMAALLARNRVKTDMFKQRFHERPGLKRKRLNSERWRARFKVGFGKVVGRVSELTRKGW